MTAYPSSTRRRGAVFTWFLMVAIVLALASPGAQTPQAPVNDPVARTGPDWDGADWSPKPPVLPLTPADEQARFILQPGYRLDPVLTDPQIKQPGSIAFDGNGRMYVLELRTYMLDADSKEELAPRSRISRWEDRNNDGVYETGTTFVDGLIFPRFVTPLGRRRHPHEGVERRRSLDVHRYEQGRRRRQT